MSDAIFIALIESAATILAVVIPSVVVALAGFSFRRYRRIKRKYETALSDLCFLLTVEHEHCLAHKELSGKSNRTLVRTIAASQYSWSGEFTPSRIYAELKYLGQ